MFFSCQKNIDFFSEKLNNNFDVVHKFFVVNGKKVAIIYLKTLVSDELLSLVVLSPLTKPQSEEVTVEYAKNYIFNTADIESVEAKNSKQCDKDILAGVLIGKVAIFIEDEESALLIDVKEYPSRALEEPPNSAVIYGPRVGFTENIDVNIAMLRKRLPSEDFVIKEFTVGKYTQTKILVSYLKTVANKQTVKEICKIIKNIKIDGIIDSNYILTYFQEGGTIFKRTGLTEKPDIVTSKILEGRVAIVVDCTPVVLTLPFMVFEDIQNPNDYYSNSIYASFLRIIRLLGVFIAVVVPGVYLALRLYHFKVLPLRFLITISNSTEGLPFTPFAEMLFILILFQVLYEVSLRLPKYLGLATSIVGALILGQTGVNAGLISPPGVVIIAVSVISVYTVSDQIAEITVLRALFLIIGGTIGILGLVGLLVYFVNELATINQFGTSYLAPYAPRKSGDLKDGLIKKTLLNMKERPKSIKTNNKVRQENDE